MTNDNPPSRSLLTTLDLRLLWILVIGGALRLYRLSKPDNGLIFDEVYYVQDARVILGLPVHLDHLHPGAQSGFDPNSEHTPLAKLIMAASMHLLGPTAFAWRLPSVILGTLSIWLVYKLVQALGGTKGQAQVAAFVLAFDNLAFVHGRIATLDIYVMTFMLLGTWLHVSRRYELAGIGFGLATLCKLNGLFGVAAIVLFEAGSLLGGKKPAALLRSLEPLFVMVAVYVAFTFCALGALDAAWTSFRSPIDHLIHIVRFGASLTQKAPDGASSTPLQWLLNDGNFEYLSVRVTSSGATKTTVLFRGAMTEYVIFAAPFALAAAAQRAWHGSRHGRLAVCLFIANYLPLCLAWYGASRTSYIYYFLQCLPAIALAIALAAPMVPRVMRIAFVLAVLFSFWMWFPLRR